MKTKFYIAIAIAVSLLETTHAQTPPATQDAIALPSVGCPGTLFSAPTGYFPSSLVQLGVNNTGTDICQQFGFDRFFQAMVWDNVTNIVTQTNFTSNIYLSWNYNNTMFGTIPFNIPVGETGGFDPDVAIFSDSSGTYLQIVFENNTTGKIDGYTYQWNGSIFTAYVPRPFKCTLSHDATKKAKNPNIAATRNKARFAVVWHEEGLVNPPQTLTITYSTVPPTTYTNTVSILESKVYIYASDRLGYSVDLLGSTTATPTPFPSTEVIRTAPAGSNHLFDRNFNPDVSFSEEPIVAPNSQNVISVTFLSQWFDPSTFGIVTGQLSVVQGTEQHFNLTTGSNVQTTTHNYTTLYTGKPRIAARLSQTGVYTAKDYSVVMGNSVSTAPPCGGTSVLTSKIHNWWFQTGGPLCPVGGTDLLLGTPYASVTSVDPVISCVNAQGHYNVVFSTNNIVANRFDIVANTYREGVSVSGGAFSAVNYGACSISMAGNQVIPAVASLRKTTSANLDKAFSNYLFWDQQNKTLNYKRFTTNNVPGGGVALRQFEDQAQDKTVATFIAYPNPTSDEILFDFNLNENELANEIEIFNMIGQSIDKFPVSAELTEQKRDVSRFPAGTYIAILKTNVNEHKLEFVKK